MGRRDFLKHGLTLAAGGLITAGLGGFALSPRAGAPSSPPVTSSLSLPAPSQGAILLPDYQDFLDWVAPLSASLDRKSLSVSMESEFAPIALQLRENDLLRYGGIDAQYDLEPYAQQLSAVLLMASTKSPSYDIFSVDGQNVGGLNGALASPSDLADAYPDLTYPGLDLDEFSSFAWNNVAAYPPGSAGSRALMYPLDMPLLVLYLRTDVYSSLGMSLPKTWDDYYDDVVAISKSGKTPYGVVNMASGTVSIVYEFLAHLASFGGSLWEVDGETLTPTFDTDQAVAALENYVRFQPYSDPGSAVYTWDDVFDDLSRGVAATGIEWHDYYTWINDPSRSMVTGKVAVTTNPSGPSGSFSTFGGSGVGVSAYSENQEAAWLWLQWATAKGTQETLLLDQYHIYPSRDDVLSQPDVAGEVSAQPAAYASTTLAQEIWASSGVAALTGFPGWLQVLPILAAQLSDAWAGRVSPSAALSAAQASVESLGRLTF